MADVSSVFENRPSRDAIEYQKESQVACQLFEKLEPHFYISREVVGTHYSGKRLRVDAVLRPRKTSDWKCKDTAFAIEIKRGEGGVGEATRHISQSVDYASTAFDGFGYLYIFTYPCPLPEYFQSQNVCFYERFLGQLGVGFLRDSWQGKYMELRLKGHTVWSELNGPLEGRFWSLARKFGSK